ncbi:hypothetical protein TNCV_4047691 [Trichonephila clavipes]|nr:hypothetical protein TNCV_4047691 [Trichonephila clavipes]
MSRKYIEIFAVPLDKLQEVLHEKIKDLHKEEAFNGLFDFSIASKAPSGGILLQSRKQVEVTWVSQYRVALMVPASKNSINKTPWASQKAVRCTLPAEGVVLNFFRIGDDGFIRSIDMIFISGMK